jgi:outer membrane biogenesis lipoprotein LolB
MALIRFLCTMNKNLIALTFLGLVAIFLGGCTTTTETTTTRTREQSSMYAR